MGFNYSFNASLFGTKVNLPRCIIISTLTFHSMESVVSRLT